MDKMPQAAFVQSSQQRSFAPRLCNEWNSAAAGAIPLAGTLAVNLLATVTIIPCQAWAFTCFAHLYNLALVCCGSYELLVVNCPVTVQVRS